MSDRIFAGFWLLLCIGGLFIGWCIQSEYSYEAQGPLPFPLAILSPMALCPALLVLLRWRAVEWPH
ncbi:tripartite tricarboxylate transporter TctB family protein, partial [Serratia marcescens]